MRLFRFLSSSRSLSSTWTYSPGDVIWRMLPTSDGFLVGESRNSETKQVTFFCLDLHTGTPVWEQKRMEEAWWIGIEAAHDGRVFLHLFARPDMPEHAGIIALDRSSGEILWQVPRLQLRGLLGEVVVVRDSSNPERGDLQISARSGEFLSGGPSADEASSHLAPSFGDPEGVAYPLPVEEGSEEWRLFVNLLQGRTLVGTCEVVQVEGCWIFSYHSAQHGASLLKHHLEICDARGRVLLADVLHAEAHMPVYDAFFVRHRSVFYIRKERELVCVSLSGTKE